ncbi:hypothetical protein LTR56_026242 [Elasticomyces elasticus]|nr:hypothetical protein LTR56_026242 [Elasticomyces elasticus]KAK3652844.1 hypothetical protein LTR22_011508 [Elasticomyces elasticus]KAK5739131.1 hypothetical protein LTS12_025367 [Elasticomyces elasticus]
MSLVNLSHVCSHLQNASLARLGLTSIPYTKLHLSLALLLHKQGFLSQVKLGGASPPAACFPPQAQPDNHRITSAPHTNRDPRSGEAALHELVYRKRSERDLREEGFGDEAVEFALQHRQLSKAQLERDGWDAKALDFLLEHGQKPSQQLEEEGFDQTAISIIARHSLQEAMTAVREALHRDGLIEDQLSTTQIEHRLRTHLRTTGFPRETLAYFAGPAHSFATPRHLANDGITLQAMGLDIDSQPITTLPPSSRDPDALESESAITRANRASRRLWLGLKYSSDGTSVLSKARMVSKPTKRIWLDAWDLGKVVRGSNSGEVRGMGRVGEVMAVSTDRGVMEARECVERRVGGMVLCRIW